MIKATRVGMTIVCVVKNKMYQKTVHSEEEVLEIFEKALNTDEENTEELDELLELLSASLTREEQQMKIEFEQEQEKLKENKELLQWIKDIKQLGDEHFEVKGISLYMKGINITIPEFLATEFCKRRDDEEDTQSLINFWRLLALNPDPRCREDLYKFLVNNHMVVTPSGYFMAYRNAKVKESSSNRQLFEFVNAEWAKIKGWKKSPSNYSVLEIREGDGPRFIAKADGILNKWFGRGNDNYDSIGNLQEMYDKFQNGDMGKTVYTDAHSGTTTIVLGQPVTIPREECDADPDRTCSRGLHLGSTSFMSRGYFGQVGLVCLCNPMKVVAVPYTDGQKLRTSEYLPIGIAEYNEEGSIIPIESATFEYDYAEHTEEELEELLNQTHFESLKTHNIIPMEIKYSDFRQIVDGFEHSMDEMKKVISNRIVKVE
jgi:hypothetical protein